MHAAKLCFWKKRKIQSCNIENSYGILWKFECIFHNFGWIWKRHGQFCKNFLFWKCSLLDTSCNWEARNFAACVLKTVLGLFKNQHSVSKADQRPLNLATKKIIYPIFQFQKLKSSIIDFLWWNIWAERYEAKKNANLDCSWECLHWFERRCNCNFLMRQFRKKCREVSARFGFCGSLDSHLDSQL